jgi:DNA repair exonuclease SbcCD ATPase subunit
MSLFAKIMVIVNFILAVVFLAAAGTLLGAAEDYKAKYEQAKTLAGEEKVNLQKQIDERQTQLEATRKTSADIQAAKAQAEGQLRSLQDSNTQLQGANSQLRADLDRLTAAQTDLQGRNAEKDKTIDSLRNELSTSESGRKEMEAKNKAQNDDIARLSQDKDTAEKALAAANAKAKSDAEQLDTLNTTLAMYKKEKGALSTGVVMNDVHGVVQAVKNDLDIFILSVGSKDGVKEGYEFTVYRDNKYVTTVVVDKVFPNYSSATTKPGTKKMDVMPGDEAATRL